MDTPIAKFLVTVLVSTYLKSTAGLALDANATLISTAGLALDANSTLVSTAEWALNSNATLRASCNPSLSHLGDANEGFEVCFAGESGNILTSALSAFGNSVWVIQNALDMGNCFCNQDCVPSQIVCEDSRKFKVILRLLGILSNNLNILGSVAQFVYALENYTAFCYCPKLIPRGQDPCVVPRSPQPCEFPKNRRK